jgi:hypothetical protein
MGLGLSTPRGISRQQLLQSTESSREFTNKLFQVMITKLTPEDFMKLSKSQTCSSFVFLMADSIGKMFDDLRIRPKRDRDSGIVYFQKVDTLRTQTAESRQLCLVIAYFYIRIFQIFGALAMSIVDDPSAGAALGVLKYQPQGPPQGLFGRQPQRIPGARGAMLGGADIGYFMSSSTLRKFLPIKELLNDPEPIQVYGDTAAKKAFPFTNSNLWLLPGRTDTRNLYLHSDDSYVFATLELSDTSRKDDLYQMRVTLKNFKYADNVTDSTTLSSINTYFRQASTDYKVISADNKETWYREGKPFTESLEDDLQKIIRKAKEYISDPEKFTKKVTGAIRPGIDGIAVPGVRPGVAPTEVGVPRVLMNQYIIQTLKGLAGYKTTSLCVARALQLLDANSLYQPRPMEATSGICTTRFDPLPTSVPEAGKPLSQIPGMKALDQLYYVNPHLGPKADTTEVLFDKVEPEYAEFLTKMIGVFGKPVSKPTTIDTILAKDPNCSSSAVKHYLRIQDPKQIQKVLGSVNQLFAKQLKHTQKVLSFFKSVLFVLKKTPQGAYVEIHPKILQGGIDELAKVSKMAREMLVEYYTGCEEEYQKGASIVLSGNHSVL